MPDLPLPVSTALCVCVGYRLTTLCTLMLCVLCGCYNAVFSVDELPSSLGHHAANVGVAMITRRLTCHLFRQEPHSEGPANQVVPKHHMAGV